MTVHRTLTHPGFLRDPHESASEVWEMSGLVKVMIIILYDRQMVKSIIYNYITQWCKYL